MYISNVNYITKKANLENFENEMLNKSIYSFLNKYV